MRSISYTALLLTIYPSSQWVLSRCCSQYSWSVCIAITIRQEWRHRTVISLWNYYSTLKVHMGNWIYGTPPKPVAGFHKKKRPAPIIPFRDPRTKGHFYEIDPNDPGVEEGDHSVEAARKIWDFLPPTTKKNVFDNNFEIYLKALKAQGSSGGGRRTRRRRRRRRHRRTRKRRRRRRRRTRKR